MAFSIDLTSCLLYSTSCTIWWTSQQSASSYKVYLNGYEKKTTSSTYANITLDTTHNSLTVKVIAYNSSGRQLATSSASIKRQNYKTVTSSGVDGYIDYKRNGEDCDVDLSVGATTAIYCDYDAAPRCYFYVASGYVYPIIWDPGTGQSTTSYSASSSDTIDGDKNRAVTLTAAYRSVTSVDNPYWFKNTSSLYPQGSVRVSVAGLAANTNYQLYFSTSASTGGTSTTAYTSAYCTTSVTVTSARSTYYIKLPALYSGDTDKSYYVWLTNSSGTIQGSKKSISIQPIKGGLYIDSDFETTGLIKGATYLSAYWITSLGSSSASNIYIKLYKTNTSGTLMGTKTITSGNNGLATFSAASYNLVENQQYCMALYYKDTLIAVQYGKLQEHVILTCQYNGGSTSDGSTTFTYNPRYGYADTIDADHTKTYYFSDEGGYRRGEYGVNATTSIYDEWPYRDGYKFMGWSTSASATNGIYGYDSDGNAKTYSTISIYQNTTLYAAWKPQAFAPSGTFNYSSRTGYHLTYSVSWNNLVSGTWFLAASTTSDFSSNVIYSPSYNVSEGVSGTVQIGDSTRGWLTPNTKYYIRAYNQSSDGNVSKYTNECVSYTAFDWTSNDGVNIQAGQLFTNYVKAERWRTANSLIRTWINSDCPNLTSATCYSGVTLLSDWWNNVWYYGGLGSKITDFKAGDAITATNLMKIKNKINSYLPTKTTYS